MSTSTSATSALPFTDETEYVYTSTRSAIQHQPPPGLSETPAVRRVLNRFGSTFLPLAAAVFFTGSTGPAYYRRTSVGTAGSRHALRSIAWTSDQWSYSEESIRLNEIRALNALLALPADEGLALDLDE